MDTFEKVVLPILAILAALAAAALLTLAVRLTANYAFRKVPGFALRSAKAKLPVFGVLSLVGVRVALSLTASGRAWFPAVDFATMAAIILALCWLAIVTVGICERLVLRHFAAQSGDNRKMRRLTTQVTLGRRIITALLITLAVAGLLLTIPEVRALGTGLLASAGLISIVAGLAVQSSLSNVFAGVQLAFTDAIRIDDVVVVEGLWGRVEEITLTYVVVRVWDERMLILPSTYFTGTPFENWTRNSPKIMGSVEFDVDWLAPVAPLRQHLEETLAGSELWDGRTGKLEVTDAVDNKVRLRIVVSAKDSGDLWGLRCLVRESMLTQIQTLHTSAIPRQRWESSPDDEGATRTPPTPGIELA